MVNNTNTHTNIPQDCHVWWTYKNGVKSPVLEVSLSHPAAAAVETTNKNNNNKTGVVVTLQRDPMESVEKFVTRLEATLLKKGGSKQTKGSGCKVLIHRKTNEARNEQDRHLRLNDVLQNGTVLEIAFMFLEESASATQFYQIQRNVPRILPDSVTITELPMILAHENTTALQFPICCRVQSEYAHQIQFQCFVGDSKLDTKYCTVTRNSAAHQQQQEPCNTSCTFELPPSSTRKAGQPVSVKCTPLDEHGSWNEQFAITTECDYPIHVIKEPGDEIDDDNPLRTWQNNQVSSSSSLFDPLLERAREMGPTTSHGVRIMTYNVLWMTNNAKSNNGRKNNNKKDPTKKSTQAHPPQPKESTSTTNPYTISQPSDLPSPGGLESRLYRQQVLAQEVLQYKSDILCLQEVTADFIRLHLEPLLVQRHYTCLYGDGDDLEEGASELAIFYNANRFECLAQKTCRISDLLRESSNHDILSECQSHPPALQFLETQPHLAQFAIFRDIQEPTLLITAVHCHLVQNPIAEQMRALQTALIVRYVTQQWEPECLASSRMADSNNAPRPRVIAGRIVCGDFNTIEDFQQPNPNCVSEATLALLKNGSIPRHHYGFWHGRQFARDPKQLFVPSCPKDQQCRNIYPSGRQCPNPQWSQSKTGCCWDDTCLICFKQRTQWKVPVCKDCQEIPDGSSMTAEQINQILLQTTSQPDDADNLFSCEISLASGGGDKEHSSMTFIDAYEAATGCVPAPIYNGYGGRPVIDGRDHIFVCGGGVNHKEGDPHRGTRTTVRIRNIAKPLPVEKCVTMPNLTWPSDHFCLVADLEFV